MSTELYFHFVPSVNQWCSVSQPIKKSQFLRVATDGDIVWMLRNLLHKIRIEILNVNFPNRIFSVFIDLAARRSNDELLFTKSNRLEWWGGGPELELDIVDNRQSIGQCELRFCQ